MVKVQFIIHMWLSALYDDQIVTLSEQQPFRQTMILLGYINKTGMNALN